MIIGVISDTHSNPVPKQVLEAFKKVDFIIHAGDFCDLKTLETLAKIKEVKGVWGNMDPSDIHKAFPAKQLIRCGTKTIGVFHGEGSRSRILERVRAEFQKDKVDVIVFGHSHQAFNEKIDNVLFFNPGSPNDPVCDACSYGMLSVTDKGIEGKIVAIK